MSVALQSPSYPEARADIAPAPAGPASPCVAFHQAVLLALLRSGEQSAGLAFGRIRAGLTAGLLSVAEPALNRLIDDERRHDAALGQHCERLPAVRAGDARTRRFFRGLESREPLVHLARVASLDACVCQVLTRVLADSAPSWGSSGVALMSGIRADEARHVKVSRTLAQMLGADATRLQRIDLEVRARFAELLQSRTLAFEALGIDVLRLIDTIRRDT